MKLEFHECVIFIQYVISVQNWLYVDMYI